MSQRLRSRDAKVFHTKSRIKSSLKEIKRAWLCGKVHGARSDENTELMIHLLNDVKVAYFKFLYDV